MIYSFNTNINIYKMATPAIHKMKLGQIQFEKIANGTKTIESRLYDEKRRQIKAGDTIEFSQNDNPEKKILVKVVSLHIYPTFSKLFDHFEP